MGPTVPDLAVLMPVYNEAATVGAVAAMVLARAEVAELLIVDDASTDATPAELARLAATDPRVKILRHNRNRGKGAALRTAIAAASAPVAVIQDADLEYDPADYAELLAPIRSGKADAVFDPVSPGKAASCISGTWRATGSDPPLQHADQSQPHRHGMRFESLPHRQAQGHATPRGRLRHRAGVTAQAARLRLRIFEGGGSYAGRTYAEGKKITWRDGLRAIRVILKG